MWWDYCPGQLVSIALVTRLGWPPRTKERTSALAEKAKTLAGWKAYATNSEPATADFVIGSYHQLWRIEKSFRMSKSDLAGRPIFHRLEGSIRAHLTIVFAALAITRIVEARMVDQEVRHHRTPLPHHRDPSRRSDRHRRRSAPRRPGSGSARPRPRRGH